MKVWVNNKEVEVAPFSTLDQLAVSLEIPERGIAVAVNNQMIPRAGWNKHILQENDRIVIIKAACGG